MQITSADFQQGSQDARALCVLRAGCGHPRTHERQPQSRAELERGTSGHALARPALRRQRCAHDADDVNKEGRTVPASLPRTNFYHWTLVDIPVSHSEIAAGACSHGITPHGKRNPPGPQGLTPGPQRLHGLVRERQGHVGRVLRL